MEQCRPFNTKIPFPFWESILMNQSDQCINIYVLGCSSEHNLQAKTGEKGSSFVGNWQIMMHSYNKTL